MLNDWMKGCDSLFGNTGYIESAGRSYKDLKGASDNEGNDTEK